MADMSVIQRLPLTTSAGALVIAYSVVTAGIRIVKRLLHPKNTPDYGSVLPLDMQEEIIRYFFHPENADDKELLKLCLTCKHWNKFISENQAWLTERMAYNARKIDEEDTYSNKASAKLDLLGTEQVFSPKIAYHFIVKRNYPRIGSFIRMHHRFNSADFERNKSTQLYVPWLNHNLLHQPSMLWLFFKTLLIAPNWLDPLLHEWSTKSGKLMRADESTIQRIKPIRLTLSILLSFLPFLDSILFRPDALVSQISNAMASENRIQYLLWEMKPWSTATFLRATLGLVSQQFFENSLGVESEVEKVTRANIRLGLIALSAILSLGPLVRQLSLGGSGLLLFLLLSYLRNKDYTIILSVCYIIPWLVYFGPVQALLIIGFVSGCVFDDTWLAKTQAKGNSKLWHARIRFVVQLLVFWLNFL